MKLLIWKVRSPRWALLLRNICSVKYSIMKIAAKLMCRLETKTLMHWRDIGDSKPGLVCFVL